VLIGLSAIVISLSCQGHVSIADDGLVPLEVVVGYERRVSLKDFARSRAPEIGDRDTLRVSDHPVRGETPGPCPHEPLPSGERGYHLRHFPFQAGHAGPQPRAVQVDESSGQMVGVDLRKKQRPRLWEPLKSQCSVVRGYGQRGEGFLGEW